MKWMVPLVVSLFLLTTPVLANETPEPASEESSALATGESSTQEVETDVDLSEAELETPIDFEILRLLGVSSALDTNFRDPRGGPGFCYHDCSDCQDRSDCLVEGFPFGFPCTTIPLC